MNLRSPVSVAKWRLFATFRGRASYRPVWAASRTFSARSIQFERSEPLLIQIRRAPPDSPVHAHYPGQPREQAEIAQHPVNPQLSLPGSDDEPTDDLEARCICRYRQTDRSNDRHVGESH